MLSHRRTQLGLIAVSVVLLMLVGGLFIVPKVGVALAQTPTPTPSPAGPTPTPPPSGVTRSVSVVGHGEVKAAPDQATITIGVESEAPSAADALDDNNTKMTALLGVIRGAGVASRDTQTSNFSIFPVYQDSRGSESPQVVGYRVSNQVTITVRDLDNLGSLLDAVVEAGANQIHGISFGFNDPQGLLDQARENAMREAERKAAQLAALADAELGQVLTISEGGVSPQPLVAMDRAMAAAVPIEPGEATVSIDIQVTYAIR